MNTSQFYARIETVLKEDFAIDLNKESDLRSIAADVLRMSDFYNENASAQTPWEEDWCQRAQLVYFLPLNVIRIRKVIREADRLGFFAGLESAVDFGSGLGAVDFAGLLESQSASSAAKLTEGSAGRSWIRPFEIERSSIARSLRGRLAQASVSSDDGPEKNADLFISSYALTELEDIPAEEFLDRSEALMIIEPSTRDDGRKLAKFRARMIAAGAYAWAPCTHQAPCPLIEKSASDWCHDRVVIDGQNVEDIPWLQKLEKHLPMKNRTLTFSYLLMSKRPPQQLQRYARLTGDALVEKGKTRQLFCRGPEREFLAWMHRHGEFTLAPRGELVLIPNGEQKSNELRIREDLRFFTKPKP